MPGQHVTYQRRLNTGAKIKLTPLPAELAEATRMATVRMPDSLYAALTAEAHDQRVSLNQLCVAKLNLGVDWSDPDKPIVTTPQTITKPEAAT